MRFISVACAALSVASVASAMRSKREIGLKQIAARDALRDSRLAARDAADVAEPKGKPLVFSNPKAKDFLVDGKSLPDINFDVGTSYSGLIPISADPNETRKLFFWFFPTTNSNTDDLVFWTNGGPGCSALEGLSQENGPWSWEPGTAHPIPNQWSWNKLASILWVEQPVGTGFSQGTPNIHNEDELAAQFVGFLNQFLNVFSELKGKNFYASGESYAGLYVPYIANYIYNHANSVPLNLKGIWITDPSVSYDLVTEHIPAVRFAQKFKEVLALNSTFLAQVQKASDACGYTDYTTKFLTYPPKGPLPVPSAAVVKGNPNDVKPECKLWDQVFEAAITVNPNFNVYRIFDVWPVLWDTLGFPGSFPNQQGPIYFNRTEVQDAIHAPHIEWAECSPINVFVDGKDTSPPSFTVLPNVIEKSERTVILHGGIDYVLIAEGTKIAIQNMTWGGKQGFQKALPAENFVINGFGAIGGYQSERKLTYVEVNLSGHMLPQYAPWAGYKTLAYLLGRDTLESHANDAGLYPSDQELYGDLAGKNTARRPSHAVEL